jgi:hypothetical protein
LKVRKSATQTVETITVDLVVPEAVIYLFDPSERPRLMEISGS